jgi:hypothetical protein
MYWPKIKNRYISILHPIMFISNIIAEEYSIGHKEALLINFDLLAFI